MTPPPPRPPPAWKACLAGLALAAAALAGTAAALDPGKAFHHCVRDAWSIEEGLPQISVLAIAQDRQGYVWAGTQAGLARFDGIRFTAYRPESSPGLPGQWIRDLRAGPDGRLWVATYRGIGVHEAGQFHAIPADARHATPRPDLLALAFDAAGRLHASHAGGVSVVEDDELRLRYPLPRPAHALLARPEGLLVGSRGGLYTLPGAGGEPQFEPLPAEAESATVTRLAEEGGRLWAGTSAGLFRRRPEGGWERFEADPELARSAIEALHVDAAGSLWVATTTHLARLRGGEVHEWVREAPVGLSVRAIAEDHEGNLWLGSQWAGLLRVRDGWTRRYSVPEGLHDPLVWSLARDADGRTWVGTNDGLAVFDGQRFTRVEPGAALPHANVYTLLPEAGGLWIGTRGGLVRREADGRLHTPLGLEALDGSQINALLRTPDGRLWIAGTRGLSVLDGEGRLRPVHRADGGPVPPARVLHHDGRQLLVGTQGGLFRVDDDALQPVGSGAGLDETMDITAIHALADGRRVLGTLDERIALEDGRGHWQVFGSADGLPVNSAFFLTDHGGYLWVAGLRGIYRVPLGDLDAALADRRRGLRGEMLLNERGDRRGGQKGYCCNGAGLAKGFLAGSELWLPTRDGVVVMDAAAIRHNPHPPATVIERVRARGTWIDVLGRGEAVLELGAEARDLDFEFTALSFQAPASVDLKVRLVGYDQDWRLLDDPSRRSLRYTNLPPGPYTFEVLAANNDGRWAETPARLRFRIAPYFHETTGFRLLLLALAGLLATAAYRWQVRRHRQQRERLEALVRQRTEALEEANRRLREASLTDPLTGLRNRRYLAGQIPADIAFYDRESMAEAAQDEVMAFALIDIDHFKRINDVHGHQAGDLVLQQFARRLEGLVRSGDYSVRWGGEEFLLVFRPLPRRHLPTLGERIRHRIAGTPFDFGDGTRATVTCSVGFAAYPLFPGIRGVPSWEQMIALADRALYRVKAEGRNGWALWQPAPGADPEAGARAFREDPNADPTAAGLVLVLSGPPGETPGLTA